MEIALTIIAIVFLLFLSAFFNGSETGLTASSRARMHAMEQDGNAKARLVNRLMRSPEKVIGAVLLGNTLVDVLASALAASLAVQLVGDVGVVYATAIMTLLIVIFAAVLPKSYALAWPDRTALLVAPFMRGVIWLLTPFTVAIQWIVRLLLQFSPSTKDDAANILAAHNEIRGTIELQTQGGAVERRDANMLGGVLDLGELQVLDIMVHRTKMETASLDEAPERVIDAVLKSQYSRVPMWRDDPDNIVGVLHTKDLLSALAANAFNPAKIDIKSFSQTPWFVPDTTSVKDQLNQFLKRKAQLALVVDEYGEVQGLITLEDILEEIVGQIADEHDTQEVAIRPQADGSVNVDGAIAVRDLNRQMHWDLPDEEATTIAGLVIHEAQAIPEAGQAFTFHGYRFEILRKSRNKLAAIRVKPVGAKAALSKRQRPERPGPGETDAFESG